MTELKLAVETERSRIDILTTWLPRIGVALFFLMIGSQKFTDPGWTRIFAQIGAGQWFRYLTGIMQVGGAVLVLVPRTTAVGCAMIASTDARRRGRQPVHPPHLRRVHHPRRAVRHSRRGRVERKTVHLKALSSADSVWRHLRRACSAEAQHLARAKAGHHEEHEDARRKQHHRVTEDTELPTRRTVGRQAGRLTRA